MKFHAGFSTSKRNCIQYFFHPDENSSIAPVYEISSSTYFLHPDEISSSIFYIKTKFDPLFSSSRWNFIIIPLSEISSSIFLHPDEISSSFSTSRRNFIQYFLHPDEISSIAPLSNFIWLFLHPVEKWAGWNFTHRSNGWNFIWVKKILDEISPRCRKAGWNFILMNKNTGWNFIWML